jgi:hypothetical protein
MKHTVLVAVLTAFTVGTHAGDWGKTPVQDKSPIEECIDLGGTITVGYETDYLFYGARFAGDSVWTDVNYSFEDFAVPINVGVWYLNGLNGPSNYDELDLYASATLGTFAGFDIDVKYGHFFFIESEAGSYGEVGLDLTRSLGFVDFYAEAIYSLAAGRGMPGGEGPAGWYYQTGVEKTIELFGAVGLVLNTGIAYSDNYFANQLAGVAAPNQCGWNHYFASASLPIELNCRTILTPYIGYNGAPDTWVADGIDGTGNGPQSDILHGGVNVAVSF